VSAPIVHPLSLAALALLLINDHVLKAAWPGWWTGKLSDLAGLAFFPLLVTAALAITTRRDVTPRAVTAAAIATGAAFAAVKLSVPAAELYRVGIAALQWPAHAVIALLAGGRVPGLGRAQLTMDASDLLALPALLMPAWVAAIRSRRERLALEVDCETTPSGTHPTAGRPSRAGCRAHQALAADSDSPPCSYVGARPGLRSDRVASHDGIICTNSGRDGTGSTIIFSRTIDV
jgi:hypothetical protein